MRHPSYLIRLARAIFIAACPGDEQVGSSAVGKCSWIDYTIFGACLTH